MAIPIGQVLIEILANSVSFRTELERARGDFGKFTSSIKSGLQTLGVGASIAGFTALVKSAVTAGSAINDMGIRLGIGTDKLQALQHTARQSGADVNDLEMGLKKLNVTMAEAANDNAEARDTLAKLGLSWRTSSGATREAGDSIEEFAQKFNSLSESMKADIFQKIFGRAKGMRNVLDELGKQGFGAVEEGARRAGVVLSNELVKALDRVGDEFDTATTSIKVGFMKAVADSEPLLLKLAKVLGQVGRALSDAVQDAEGWWKQLDSAVERLMNRFGGPGFQPLKPDANIGVGNLDVGTTVEPTPGPPPISTAQKLQQIQNAAQAALNAIAVREAAARAQAPGGAEGDIDQLNAQIRAVQERLDVEAKLAAQIRATDLTDKGRMDASLKLGKAVADAAVARLGLERQLEDAILARATEDVQGMAQAAEAQNELNASLEVGTKNLMDWATEDRLRLRESIKATQELILLNEALTSEQGDEAAGFGMLAAAPRPGAEDFLKRGQVLADFNKEMKAIEISSKTMGFEFDTNTAKIAAMETALRKFAEDGVDPTDEAVQKLSSDLAALKLQSAIIGDIFGALKNAVDTSVQGIILGTTTLKEAFRNMGQSIAVSLVQSAVDRGIKLLQKAIEDFIQWLAETGLIKQAAGFVAGLASSAFAPSTTTPGVSTGDSGGFPTASGGVFYGAQKRLIAEAGPEAVVPLEGGAVPVKMIGGARWEQPMPMAGYARGGDTIIIQNNTSAEVTHKSEQTPDGSKVRTFIISEVKRGIEGGEFDKTFGIYGLKRQPVAR